MSLKLGSGELQAEEAAVFEIQWRSKDALLDGRRIAGCVTGHIPKGPSYEIGARFNKGDAICWLSECELCLRATRSGAMGRVKPADEPIAPAPSAFPSRKRGSSLRRRPGFSLRQLSPSADFAAAIIEIFLLKFEIFLFPNRQ